jgi:hypothetical protein
MATRRASRTDLENIFFKARNPLGSVAASGAIVAQGKEGLVTEITVVGGAAGPVVNIRDGGSLGTIIAAATVPALDTVQLIFPAGLEYDDGVYVEVVSGNATVYATGYESTPVATTGELLP